LAPAGRGGTLPSIYEPMASTRKPFFSPSYLPASARHSEGSCSPLLCWRFSMAFGGPPFFFFYGEPFESNAISLAETPVMDAALEALIPMP